MVRDEILLGKYMNRNVLWHTEEFGFNGSDFKNIILIVINPLTGNGRMHMACILIRTLIPL